MTKALFYIEGEKVQHVGLRLIVTNKIIHAGFTRGGAFNMPDGRVEVVLEGDKEMIQAIHKEIKEHLIDWLKERAKDEEELKKITNPAIKRVTDLEFKEDLLVLDVGLFSHSLTFDQIYKGVDVYKDLTSAIKELKDGIAHIAER
ncbi:MAG: acylphosphatase [Candidatus Diapherotrites archaeon]|uniref:acylphosphatase n=1 Tax=Candidatus Iainarchaeum sp. TaxID=3101447 RepID=A0A8T4KV64_9ARCH|nr:acylphosphatase [Candidatus Diapherotrites archaeon]